MLNNVIFCGRTTSDLELKTTTSGKSVTSFTLAVERDYSSNGERETDFIPVVAWGNTAEFASKYFSKGKLMIVSGRLQLRNYTDKYGNKRNVMEVIASNVYFAGDKGNTNNDVEKPSFDDLEKITDDFTEFDMSDADLPF